MRTIPIALVLVLAGLTAAPAAALAADQRPIEGRFTLTLVGITGGCGEGEVMLHFVGTGTIAHFGRVDGSATNCTSATLGSEAVPISDGVAIYVAADGSSVTARYEGAQAAPLDGVAEVFSTNTVIAGTGRFAGAAGTWSITGVVDLEAGTSSGALSGWISY